MKPTLPRSLRFAGILLAVLSLVTSALAGPPLICHRFDIGSAKSLPWTGSAWNLADNQSYDTRNLARDTLALLQPGVPVIVRMETLRRATLYAAKDPGAAKDLLVQLQARTTTGAKDALAWFDYGYFIESYHQWAGRGQDLAAGPDGYALVKNALSLRGDDPEMEFAAAFITLHGPNSGHPEHAQKAIAGAKGDSLLARNLAAGFRGDAKHTVADAFSQS